MYLNLFKYASSINLVNNRRKINSLFVGPWSTIGQTQQLPDNNHTNYPAQNTEIKKIYMI